MKAKASGLWKYITITVVSVLLIAVFAITYSATITNEMHRLQDEPVIYRTFNSND